MWLWYSLHILYSSLKKMSIRWTSRLSICTTAEARRRFSSLSDRSAAITSSASISSNSRRVWNCPKINQSQRSPLKVHCFIMSSRTALRSVLTLQAWSNFTSKSKTKRFRPANRPPKSNLFKSLLHQDISPEQVLQIFLEGERQNPKNRHKSSCFAQFAKEDCWFCTLILCSSKSSSTQGSTKRWRFSTTESTLSKISPNQPKPQKK